MKEIVKTDKSKENKKLSLNIKSVISVALMVIAVFTVLYYMFGPSEGYLHSDCVDTMTWAGATIDSGKMFSDTFNYPYLLPFGATFFVYPFELIFGFTMVGYRIAMLVFMLCFATATYFVARGMKWSRNFAFIAVAIELIILSSSGKLRELFWEHIIHYSVGPLLAFVLLALVFAFINCYENNKTFKNNRNLICITVALALWAFFSAFDELTTLTLSTVPALGAIVLYAVFNIKEKIISVKNKDLIILLCIIVISTILGSIGLSIAAKDIATNYGDAYSVISDRAEWSNNLMRFLEQWTSLLGADYTIGGAITDKENIFAAVKMVSSLVLFITPVYGVFIYNKYSKNEKLFLIFHWLLTGFILYAFVFGNLSNVNWRLTPIIPSAIIVNITVWKYLWRSINLRRVAVILSFFVVLASGITGYQILSMPWDYGMDNDHHKAIEMLERHNLDYGYATYWNANILTLLSDGKVKVRDINMDEEKIRPGWLNNDNLWYNAKVGQENYFILLSNDEYNKLVEQNNEQLQDTSYIFREGNWVVLVKDHNIF